MPDIEKHDYRMPQIFNHDAIQGDKIDSSPAEWPPKSVFLDNLNTPISKPFRPDSLLLLGESFFHGR